MIFPGIVEAEVIEAKFAISGRIAEIFKKPGDRVSVGDFIASLDKKELQAILDRELSDFQRIRADFEIYAIDNAPPSTDRAKYEKQRQQAMLNVSVKAVELAKYRLDETDLRSPVDGWILPDNGLRAGMYITPGSSPVAVLDKNSFTFCIEVDWSELHTFTPNREYSLTLKNIPNPITPILLPLLPIPGKKTSPTVSFKLPPALENVWVGMTGDLSVIK